MNNSITDNTERSRFELEEGGFVTFADYKIEGKILTIKYVEAPTELRGTGSAGQLLEGITDIARKRGLKITPICGFAAAWLRKHKEHHSLMA